MITYVAVSSLINAGVALICGISVLLHNPNHRKNIHYFLYCGSVSLWSLFFYLWLSVNDYETALLFLRICMLGAILIPCQHYHHLLIISGLKGPQHKRILWLSYSLAAVFIVSNFTNGFIARLEQRLMFPFWPVAGPLYYVYIASFITLLVLGFRSIRDHMKISNPLVARQLRWSGWSTLIAYGSGCLSIPLWFNIPIVPLFNLGVSIGLLINTYVLLNAGVFEIKTAIKRLSLLVLIYGFLLAVGIGSILPMARFLLMNSSISPFKLIVGSGLALGFVFALGPLFYSYFVKNEFWLKTQFTTGLAHELKSPLGAIHGATDILLKAIHKSGVSKSTQLDYLEMILKNTERLEGYAADLLTIAKIQDSSVDVIKQEGDIPDIIKDAADLFKLALDEKGLSIVISADKLPKISFDKEKIRQTLSNILSNAIKYSDKSSIKIDSRHKNGHVAISISDQGRGIPKEDLEKIFDRFYQGTNSAKGSGIGLSIAKAWVEAHGGRIWAESEGEGRGTKVTFTLPIT